MASRAAPDDATLILSHLEGQPGAFEALFRRYQPQLVRFCRRRLRDHALAEDIAQETLVRTLATLAGFDIQRPLWPWLKRVASNLVVDSVRSSRRETVLDDIDPPDRSNPFRRIEERSVLQPVLATLTNEQRTAVRLSYVEGWSHGEAAEFLGLSGAAFKQLLYRARTKMQAEYRRLTEGCAALVAGGYRVARRFFDSVGARLSRVGENTLGLVSTEMLHQATAAIISLLLLGTPLEGGTPRPTPNLPPVADAAVRSLPEPPIRPPDGPATGSPRTEPPASPGVIAHKDKNQTTATPNQVAEESVADVVDPNRNTARPEDARITSMEGSQSGPSGPLLAAGIAPCRENLCDPVLFASQDGGSSWERLPAAGFSGQTLLLPPGFGVSDDRIFAIGPDGIQVSRDGGKSFGPAAANPGAQTNVGAAMSPQFSKGDPTILLGGTTLQRYRDDIGIVEPYPADAAPGPFEPAYSPAYAEDRTIFLGAIRVDPVEGTAGSVVYQCVDGTCNPAPLGLEQTIPLVRIPEDPALSQTVYAFTQQTLFASADGGQTFAELSPLPEGLVLRDLEVRGAGELFVATFPEEKGGPGGLYRSFDSGTSWTKIDHPLLTDEVAGISQLGDRLIALDNEAGFACSLDGGVSWAPRCPALAG